MKHARYEAAFWKSNAETIGDILVGRIDHITKDGVAFVDYPSNTRGPTAAASAISSSQRGGLVASQGAKVLLTFENRDPLYPVIIGFVHDTLFPMELPTETTLENEQPMDVVIDGETMQFNAREEIVLRCGKSCIIMKKDGKVVIKGVEVTNRAARTNRVQGGSVKIN